MVQADPGVGVAMDVAADVGADAEGDEEVLVENVDGPSGGTSNIS